MNKTDKGKLNPSGARPVTTRYPSWFIALLAVAAASHGAKQIRHSAD